MGWVFIGKKISGFSPSLWPRPKIFFFSNYSSPLARPRPIAADHFLKPLSRLLDQRKEKDVQESLTKVSSFLWPKPKEMKEMVSRFAPAVGRFVSSPWNLLRPRAKQKLTQEISVQLLWEIPWRFGPRPNLGRAERKLHGLWPWKEESRRNKGPHQGSFVSGFFFLVFSPTTASLIPWLARAREQE